MKRTVTAFLIAPLVPPLLYWAFDPTRTLAALPGVIAYGDTIGYLAIAIVGVPAYRLITIHSRLRAGHVLAIAAVVGAVTLSLMSHSPLESRTLGLGALYGLSAGVSFWLVWRGNAAQPAVAADGASRPR
jgi:hypothetical protein